jgi:cytochrome c-type biogenesis protein CcmH
MMVMRRLASLWLAVGLALSGTALAVQPDEVLPNATLEQRARQISGGLRCLVCQNQSIDDSDAPLARDLRILVRERLVAGDSDAAVQRFRRRALWRFRAAAPALQRARWRSGPRPS